MEFKILNLMKFFKEDLTESRNFLQRIFLSILLWASSLESQKLVEIELSALSQNSLKHDVLSFLVLVLCFARNRRRFLSFRFLSWLSFGGGREGKFFTLNFQFVKFCVFLFIAILSLDLFLWTLRRENWLLINWG